MARDGGTQGDIRRDAVPDLAHGDDIRVLPEDAPQGGGEAHAGLLLNGHLIDPGQVVFHRVLQGHQIHIFPVQQTDHGVHGGGFARPGGAGQQEHSAAGVQKILKLPQPLSRQAQSAGGQKGGGFVQQTNDDLLAPDRGHGGDPQVHLGAAKAKLAASVLRDPVLRNVQLAHHLHPGQNGCAAVRRDGEDLPQVPVDPQPHPQTVLPGLQMHVRGIQTHRIFQNAVDGPDGGASILLPKGLRGSGGGQLAQSLLHGIWAVGSGNAAADGLRGCQQGLDGHSCRQGRFVCGGQIQRVRHGKQQGIARDPKGDHPVPPGQLPGDGPGGLRVGQLPLRIGKADAQPGFQGRRHRRRGGIPQGKENVGQRLPGHGLMGFGGIQLFLCDAAPVCEELSEPPVQHIASLLKIFFYFTAKNPERLMLLG